MFCASGMNVQSANNKIDDIVAMKRERDLDVLCFCETWHDQDSVSIRRLRAEGLQVLECARPRPSDTMPSISTNHGGVALAASRGIRLTAINTGGQRRSLEHICARVTSRNASCVVLLVYRPGSVAVDACFFTDLADLLDRLATFADPVMLVGDLNIRLDRSDDPMSRRLCDLLESYDMNCKVNSATHDCGGLLDIVAARDKLTTTVEVIDPGLTQGSQIIAYCDGPVVWTSRHPFMNLSSGGHGDLST